MREVKDEFFKIRLSAKTKKKLQAKYDKPSALIREIIEFMIQEDLSVTGLLRRR